VKKKQKQRYRAHNWREYNAALVKRGSLTVGLDEASLEGWRHRERSGKRGASFTYRDAAITAFTYRDAAITAFTYRDAAITAALLLKAV